MKKLVIYCYLLYLRILAKLQLAKMRLRNPNFKIVGISGSAGKTSTMMAVVGDNPVSGMSRINSDRLGMV